MYLFLSIAFSFCIVAKVTMTAAQTCYYPDGSVSERDTPCRATSQGQASECCAWLDVCLDNSLCLAQDGGEVISRGTCTDRSWQSDQCPKYCQDGIFPTISCAMREMSCSIAPLSVVMEFVDIIIG